MKLDQPWPTYTYVAFDTETSGSYPLGSDIVEFGAVKWKDGQVVDRYSTLLKPSQAMSAFIIGIHGITNEMVEDAPSMKEKIQEIRQFLSGAVGMAHHAPFDMGFLVADFERYKIPFPTEPVLCTSLLARNIIHDSPNHKLQTLIKVLGIDGGQAHRATSDAEACLQVGLECLRRLGPETTLASAQKAMKKRLHWIDYSLLMAGRGQNQQVLESTVEALQKHQDLDIQYDGGSLKNSLRRISPIGIVRNPDGDYLVAICHIDRAQKRFYLSKIREIQTVAPPPSV